MTASRMALYLLSLTAAVALAACTGSTPAAPDVAPASEALVAPAGNGGGVLTASGRGEPGAPIVYVKSQGLFYDSIVRADLPPHGPFQLLEMGGPTGLQTEFGPGDPGYRGGRWKFDSDGDGTIDKYFECPLLGPGREEP